MRSFVAQKGKLYAARTAEFFEHQNHLAAELASPELLDLIDGTRTCSDIAGAIDADDAAVVLYTLDYLKMLSYQRNSGAGGGPASLPGQKTRTHQCRCACRNVRGPGRGALRTCRRGRRSGSR